MIKISPNSKVTWFLKTGLLTASLSACSQNAMQEAPVQQGVLPLPSHAAPAVNEYMTRPAILIFSETKGWRHEEGIIGASKAIIEISRDMEYGVMSTENSEVFNAETLENFKIVVMNNMTGDALTPQQEHAFQIWVEAGGGVIMLHGSGDASHKDWDWYQTELIGPTFISHPMAPQFQTAKVETLNGAHAVMTGVPPTWEHSEEWYTFDSRAQDHGMTVLAGLDETSYSPINMVYGVEDLRMDTDGQGAIAHPVIWSRCIGKGRSVYSAMGHLDDVYMSGTPRVILTNGLNWVAKITDKAGVGCTMTP